MGYHFEAAAHGDTPVVSAMHQQALLCFVNFSRASTSMKSSSIICLPRVFLWCSAPFSKYIKMLKAEVCEQVVRQRLEVVDRVPANEAKAIMAYLHRHLQGGADSSNDTFV